MHFYSGQPMHFYSGVDTSSPSLIFRFNGKAAGTAKRRRQIERSRLSVSRTMADWDEAVPTGNADGTSYRGYGVTHIQYIHCRYDICW
jgi:hypothetical protein